MHQGGEQVFFGATVRYLQKDGRQQTVTIVGIDEADSLAGQVSWVSPVARALLKAHVGDEVPLHTPQGLQVLEVLQVSYPAPAR